MACPFENRGFWHLARDALDVRDMFAEKDCQGARHEISRGLCRGVRR